MTYLLLFLSEQTPFISLHCQHHHSLCPTHSPSFSTAMVARCVIFYRHHFILCGIVLIQLACTGMLLLSMYTLILLTMRLCAHRNSWPKWTEWSEDLVVTHTHACTCAHAHTHTHTHKQTSTHSPRQTATNHHVTFLNLYIDGSFFSPFSACFSYTNYWHCVCVFEESHPFIQLSQDVASCRISSLLPLNTTTRSGRKTTQWNSGKVWYYASGAPQHIIKLCIINYFILFTSFTVEIESSVSTYLFIYLSYWVF